MVNCRKSSTFAVERPRLSAAPQHKNELSPIRSMGLRQISYAFGLHESCTQKRATAGCVMAVAVID